MRWLAGNRNRLSRSRCVVEGRAQMQMWMRTVVEKLKSYPADADVGTVLEEPNCTHACVRWCRGCRCRGLCWRCGVRLRWGSLGNGGRLLALARCRRAARGAAGRCVLCLPYCFVHSGVRCSLGAYPPRHRCSWRRCVADRHRQRETSPSQGEDAALLLRCSAVEMRDRTGRSFPSFILERQSQRQLLTTPLCRYGHTVGQAIAEHMDIQKVGCHAFSLVHSGREGDGVTDHPRCRVDLVEREDSRWSPAER
jgi:hypothetical protein